MAFENTRVKSIIFTLGQFGEKKRKEDPFYTMK